MASDFPDYPGAPAPASVSFADRYVTAVAAANAASSNQPKIYDPFASSYASAKTINALAEQAMQAVAGEGEPIPEVYGTARVAVRLATVAGDSVNNVVYLLCVWCGGPVEAVNKVLIGGVEVAADRMQHHLGTSGQSADSWLGGLLSGYADALAGICYTVIKCATTDTIDTRIFGEIQGRNDIYDPRVPSTGYSDNPALCLAHLIDTYTNHTLDWSSVEDCADACDELVSGAKRRVIGLSLETPAEILQVVDGMREYAGCFVQWAEPVVLTPNRPRVTDGALTAANIRSIKLSKRGMNALPNQVTVRYTDASGTEWKQATAVVSDVASGAEIRPQIVDMPGFMTHAEATRQATERLNYFRKVDLDAEIDVFDEGLQIARGDVRSVTHPIGLSAKLMRVLGATSTEPGRWRVTAEEYDETVYSDAVDSKPSASDTNLPDPTAIPAGPTPAIVEENYQLQNGTYATRLRITWSAVTYGFPFTYRLRVTQGGTLVWSDELTDTSYTTGAVQEGLNYSVSLCVAGPAGLVGTVGTNSITALGKQLPPPDVTNFRVSVLAGEVTGSWDPVLDDVWRYEIRYGSTSSWSAATRVTQVDGIGFNSRDIPTGTWYILIKALDSVREPSVNAASQQVFVGVSNTVRIMASGVLGMNGTDSANMVQIGSLDQWVTAISGDTWNSLFTAAMNTYTNALFTYHSSGTSTWYSESLDAGSVVTGTWQAQHSGVALNGSITAVLQTSDDDATWTTHAELTARVAARYARVRLQALTTSTLHVTGKAFIRVDTEYREESGSGTTDGSGILTVTLSNDYVSMVRVVVNPTATAARSYTITDFTPGDPSSFKIRLFNSSGTAVASESVIWEFRGV
jgi:hypothetical protein